MSEANNTLFDCLNLYKNYENFEVILFNVHHMENDAKYYNLYCHLIPMNDLHEQSVANSRS